MKGHWILLKSADIIHGIIILMVKGKKMLKGDIGALLRKYSDSKFAKLYIMAHLILGIQT